MKPYKIKRESVEELFAAEALKPEIDLGRAAFLIAKSEYPSLDVDAYVRRLDDIAKAISKGDEDGADERAGDVTPSLSCFRLAWRIARWATGRSCASESLRRRAGDTLRRPDQSEYRR